MTLNGMSNKCPFKLDGRGPPPKGETGCSPIYSGFQLRSNVALIRTSVLRYKIGKTREIIILSRELPRENFRAFSDYSQ